jgi:NAD(P)-dependent dehydrogenase (short-subunit alcohol dehydrogenase family)
MGDERALAGRHAVVTGAGKGIGAAIAEALAREGARVTLMGRDRAALEARAAAIGKAHGAETATARCDVADEASVAGAFGEARARFGPVHVLVNNAGQAASARFLDTPREDWDRLLAVNLTGAYLCTRQALGAMLEAGAGRIVNVASTAGLRGGSRLAAYCASKHGLVGLTRALAAEVGKHGITVNAVCPGYVDTEMAEQAVRNLVKAGRAEAEARALIAGSNPGGRLIAPEEVARVVVWLCSPEAAAVNGQAMVVAGGDIG